MAGVIGRERIPTFERMLWRVCRGNVFLRQADIEDPLEDPATVSTVKNNLQLVVSLKKKKKVQSNCSTLRTSGVQNYTDQSLNCIMFPQGDQVHKSVFIIFFQGDQLKNRVKKICEG